MGVPELLVLGQVLLIDLVLAGDNALLVGLVVARLPPAERQKAIWAGIGAAALLRLGLAGVTMRLLHLLGLRLAGGLLLLWVGWKSWRELRAAEPPQGQAASGLAQAMLRIMLADLSMSLDNVLAVAGAAMGHPWLMAAGLLIAVGLMGVAATLIARLLARYRVLAWGGIATILYVALRLIWQGGQEVAGAMAWV